MRKFFTAALLLAMLCLCHAQADALPTIDQALAAGGNERVQVQCDIPAFDFYQASDFLLGDCVAIILERHCPEKEFTPYDSGYPDNYVDGLPDDFTGFDCGEMGTWLRLDLMQELPEWMRASSLEEADFLYIVEDQYYLSGRVAVTTFDIGSDNVPTQEFKSPEALKLYNLTHPRKISAITFYPKFTHELYGYFYNPKTGETMHWAYEAADPKRLARNPRAADLSDTMQDLYKLSEELLSGQLCMSGEELIAFLSNYADVPEEKASFWALCLDNGETAAAFTSIQEYYWVLAEALIEADPVQVQKDSLSRAVAAKNAAFLKELTDIYDYWGFDTPIETIGQGKEYMGQLNGDAYEECFKDFLSLLKD